MFVFFALLMIHSIMGWHKADMTALPGEAKIMETLRGLNVQPGDYRFPFSNSTEEMRGPEFAEKMNQGPVRLFARHRRARRLHHRPHARRGRAVPRSVSREWCLAFFCYVVAHWQNRLWWGKSTRFTVTNSLDGIIYALITGATFGWLWPH